MLVKGASEVLKFSEVCLTLTGITYAQLGVLFMLHNVSTVEKIWFGQILAGGFECIDWPA